MNLENTGGQDLTGIELTDDLDTIFSGAYDAFIPSTAGTTTGGITALDASATIVTDTGTAIGTLSTNSTFDGGTDTNLFATNTAVLNPGDEISVTYTILVEPNTTGASVDFTNAVDATATDAFDLDTTDNATSAAVTIAPAPDPEMTLTKVADIDTNVQPGQTVTYTYTVENTGGVNIDNVTVSDVHGGMGLLSAIAGEAGDASNSTDSSDATTNDGTWDILAPGDIVTFESTYVVNAFDVLAGSTVSNLATATGNPASGTLTDPTATEIITVAGTARPALAPGTCGAFEAEGFLVTPGGPTTERNIDWLSGATGPTPYDPYTFMPEVTRNAATGVISFFQTSVDGTASGAFLPSGATITSAGDGLTSALASAAPNVSEIWRIAARVEGVPGTTETITIQNGGAQEHSAYWQTDSSGAIINTNSSVNPLHDDGWLFGAQTTIPGGDDISYTIDVTYPSDGIVIINFAMFDATGGFGGPTFDGYECPEPELTIGKIADVTTNVAAGDTVTYTYTVENTGNVDVADVTVTDVHSGTGTLSPITIDTLTNTSTNSSDDGADNDVDVLAPGDSVTFEATYTVTQADIDEAADITNTATATGDPLVGDLTDPTATETVDVEDIAPALDIDKPAPALSTDADGDGVPSIGDTLTYTITATNTGNVALTGVQIVDTLITPSTENCGTLAVGGTCQLVGTYLITPNDIGEQIDNTATASSNETPDVTDFVETPIEPPAPSLELIKAADTSGLSTPLALGDTITYTFTVENTGDVILANVAPVDTLTLGTTGTGAAAFLTTGPTLVASSDPNSNGLLDVGETFEYTATFDLTQAAIDAGGVQNTAVSTGTVVDDAGTVLPVDPVSDMSDNDSSGDGTDGGVGGTGDDPTVVTFATTPALGIVKSTPVNADEDGSTTVSIGDTLSYTITVTNTGNVTQSNVVVSDPMLVNDRTTTCASVPVGGTCTLTGDYVVTMACLLYTSPSPRDRG